jgi:CDP-diacylglycerol--glycerol-3-phosphate 3-phosphatidyltransferase
MSLYELKPRFQALLRPGVRALHGAGATANQVTLLACAVSVALGIWIAFHADTPGWFLLLPLWFVLRMALNAVDGMLAREFGQASTLGAYLNELTDVISDAALYLPFAFVPGAHPLAVAAVVFLAAVSEMTGVLGRALGASRRYDGPMGKSDRAFVFGALALVLGLGIAPGAWLNIVLCIVAAAVALTVVNRVRRGAAEIAAGKDA